MVYLEKTTWTLTTYAYMSVYFKYYAYCDYFDFVVCNKDGNLYYVKDLEDGNKDVLSTYFEYNNMLRHHRLEFYERYISNNFILTEDYIKIEFLNKHEWLYSNSLIYSYVFADIWKGVTEIPVAGVHEVILKKLSETHFTVA